MSTEVTKRRAIYGDNVLPAPPPKSLLRIFLRQVRPQVIPQLCSLYSKPQCLYLCMCACVHTWKTCVCAWLPTPLINFPEQLTDFMVLVLLAAAIVSLGIQVHMHTPLYSLPSTAHLHLHNAPRCMLLRHFVTRSHTPLTFLHQGVDSSWGFNCCGDNQCPDWLFARFVTYTGKCLCLS